MADDRGELVWEEYRDARAQLRQALDAPAATLPELIGIALRRLAEVPVAVQLDPDSKGVKVTCVDLATGETGSGVIQDDVMVIVAGSAYVHDVQDYPKSGTQVWTIKGRGGRG